MKYIKLYKDKESAVGQILETPAVVVAGEKTAIAPVSLGETVKITEVGNTIAFIEAPTGPTYEMVDLGLSVKWAKCNVGATKPEDPGLYFAWGETEGYAGDAGHKFSFVNYKWSIGGSSEDFSKYNTTGAKLDLEDDAARANMGGSWRMPTAAEIDELINNTTRTWTDDYEGTGKAGYIVKSKTNSNQIFMPAAGSCYGTSLSNLDQGYYWSSSQSSDDSCDGDYMGLYSGGLYCSVDSRSAGFSVRGVCE